MSERPLHEYVLHFKGGGSVSAKNPEDLNVFRKVERQMEDEQTKWLAEIRAIPGVKAAHPDDGWVNRVENYVVFCYPYFQEPALGQGDLVVLGSPPWNGRVQHRVVRITGVRRMSLGTMRYYFEPVQ